MSNSVWRRRSSSRRLQSLSAGVPGHLGGPGSLVLRDLWRSSNIGRRAVGRLRRGRLVPRGRPSGPLKLSGFAGRARTRGFPRHVDCGSRHVPARAVTGRRSAPAGVAAAFAILAMMPRVSAAARTAARTRSMHSCDGLGPNSGRAILCPVEKSQNGQEEQVGAGLGRADRPASIPRLPCSAAC
jgi:hypothetical protein